MLFVTNKRTNKNGLSFRFNFCFDCHTKQQSFIKQIISELKIFFGIYKFTD